MKRKFVLFLSALILLGITITSCRSRQPHCPGVYSKAVETEVKTNS